jgi:hypothetical protein
LYRSDVGDSCRERHVCAALVFDVFPCFPAVFLVCFPVVRTCLPEVVRFPVALVDFEELEDVEDVFVVWWVFFRGVGSAAMANGTTQPIARIAATRKTKAPVKNEGAGRKPALF